jgi:hypothetical protein
MVSEVLGDAPWLATAGIGILLAGIITLVLVLQQKEKNVLK